MRRRTGSLKPALVGLGVAVVISAGLSAYVAQQHALSLPTRIEISPADASVFAGSSIAMHATLVGGDGKAPVRWSVVGPGTISESGVYAAPLEASGAVTVVAQAGAVAASARVRVDSAPPDVPLVLVSCYEEASLDVREAASLRRSGMLLAPELPAGMAVDAQRGLVLVAAKERVMAVDLRTMRATPSEPMQGSRFSGAAALAGGYFAVTDNLAAKGAPGVFFFRIVDGRPLAAGSVAAGETPEGIVAEPGGRIFYVTNINSDEVLRYSFDGRGGARIIDRVATGTRPFGIALDATRRLLFVTDNDTPYLSGARSHSGVEMFALPSLLRLGGSVDTGSKNALPIGAAVDSRAGRLFVTNEGDSNVIVFELPTMRRIAALPTGRLPWTPKVDADAGRLYVPSARDDRVDVFDTHTLRRIGEPAPTCGYPTNVLIAPRRSP